MSRWFRYYDDSLNDPKVQRLPDALFKAWVNILCIASKNNGELPNLGAVAFGLRVSEAKAAAIVAELATRILLDPIEGGYFRPHNWDGRQFKSDVSTDRVREFRERKAKQQCNVSSAVSETPPEQNITEQNQNRENGVVEIGSLRDVKKEKPPRHGARSRCGRFVYFNVGSMEYDAYADDYRAVTGEIPNANTRGGRWFNWLGETG